MTIFAKSLIIILRLGSKYVSVIINLISTLATQLYSKITKINEIFLVITHFYLKLAQKLRKKVLIFRRSSLTTHKDKFMSRGILSPATSSQEQFFLKKNFFHLQFIAKRSAGDDVAQLWSRDPEIIILI